MLGETGECLSLSEVKEMGEASFAMSCVWHDRGDGAAAGGSLLQFPHLIFQVKP